MKKNLFILLLLPLLSMAQTPFAVKMSKGSDGAAIYVDNVRVRSLAHINPNDVASVTVFRPADAVKLYGRAARNGAIVIITKNFRQKQLARKQLGVAPQQDIASQVNFRKSEFVDSLNLWTYYLKPADNAPTDSVKALGYVYFYRNQPVIDSNYFKEYHRYWTPGIGFYIYNLSDSLFCKKMAHRTKVMSSCEPPSVGGDYLVVGKFIFVNNNVCVDCQNPATLKEYCRPVVHAVLSKIDESKANTLDGVFSQFVIKKTGP